MQRKNSGTRLLIILLVSSLMPVFAVAGQTFFAVRQLSIDSTNANIRLGTQTMEDSEAALIDQAERYLQTVAREQAGKANAAFERAEDEVQTVAQYVAALYLARADMPSRETALPSATVDGVASSKNTVAPGIDMSDALKAELGLLGNAERLISLLQQNNDLLSNVYIGTQSGLTYRYSASSAYDPTYDPRLRPWYGRAVAAGGQPIWTVTERDAYGIMCCTVAVAFSDADGALIGVAASDVTLERMQADIESAAFGESGYTFVADRSGHLIAHPEPFEDGASVPDELKGAFTDARGHLTATLDGQAVRIAYHQLPSTGWVLATVIEDAEIIAPALDTSRDIVRYAEAQQDAARETTQRVATGIIVVIAAVTLGVILVSYFLSRKMAKSLADEGDEEQVPHDP